MEPRPRGRVTAPAGNYTVVVVTSLGDFRAEVRVTPPAQALLVGRGKAKATVCAVRLNVYRRPWEDLPPEKTFSLQVTVP